MSINIGPPSVEELRPRIVVIGVGGAGGNAIANMITSEIEGVDFVVANTDAQALNNALAEHRIQLGPDITQGLGAGSRPEVGRAAAEETVEEIERALDGVNMVFIAAGMGGGTGTGAAPVIAETARRMGVLTVGVVTKPFLFEGTRRMRAADAGIEELQKHVDTLIVIPNQNLFLVAKAETTFKEAFQLADEVLQQGVRSITDLMVMPGLINLDFADVRSVMGEMGKAMMGTGEGEGANRALEAAERAIANPLLDGVSMQGAKGVIISIIGGEDMKLLEIDEAANHIRELVDPEANIIWGSAFNPDLEGKIRVSVVATGIEQSAEQAAEASRPLNLGGARGPKKPVLPLPTEEELAEDAAAAEQAAGLSIPDDDWGEEPVEETVEYAAAAPLEEQAYGYAEDEDEEEAEEEPAVDASPLRMPEPYSPGDGGDEDEEYDEEGDSDDSGAFGGRDSGFASLTGTRINRDPEGTAAAADNGWDMGDEPEEGGEELELTMEAAGSDDGDDEGGQDELLLDADRLAEADEPAQQPGSRRARMLGASGGEAAQAGSEAAAPAKPSGGSTLFERMANLSRAATDRGEEGDDEDDDDDAGSVRIPRFLNRQNNQ
ncbi:cell division protein FtsZ [Altererythrobacter salegens]|uniref:Cell division protein FtsZ n=1 Tax=Croceibacterium salegens TaxID=1737568 RepID=A0A6I4SQ16_9SPHN|nr:cell division protein FtsZ [Croceibacterium salegens]MXO58021.1 cell division protein FtsZ [Croceibacterium salegens]